MTYSEFEKNASKKINQYASGVDGEALWASILPELQVEKKKRRGFFWFFFAGLFVLVSGLYLWNLESTNPDPDLAEFSISTPMIENPEEDINTSNKNQIAAEAAGITELPGNNLDKDVTKRNKSDNPPDLKKDSPKPLNNKNSNLKYKAISSNTLTQNPLQAKNDTENLITPTQANIVPLLDDEKDESIVSAQPESKPGFNDTPEDRIELELGSTKPEENNEEAIDELSIVINDDTASENIKKEENLEEVGEYTPPLPNKLRLNFGFGVYGGISRSTTRLKNRENTDPGYLPSRLNSEKQLETLHLGVDILAKTKHGLYFRTGIQYSRIARKFSIDAQRIEFDTIQDGIQAIYVNTTTNDTILVYGEVIKEITTTYDKNTYNYFHLLDIPLVAGYTFDNDQWSFGVEAGAVFNVSNKSKGEIFDLSGEFYNLETDNKDWYKTNIGVGFTAGLSVAYHLDYNFQVYLSPAFRLGSVFSTDKNPVKQSHASLGVNAGVRYFLD